MLENIFGFIAFVIFSTGAVVWIVVIILGIISLLEIFDKGSKK